MVTKFQKHIQDNLPFLRGKKVLIAISGGIDSVVLTYLCAQVSDIQVALAHCNFQLRGNESDLDEKFVVQIGKSLNIPCFVTHFDTQEYACEQKLSIQLAARELRYQWFENIIEEHDYDYVLTAHHLNDSLETFLINMTRGTGLDGLVGIPEHNNLIVRPLLPFSQAEIHKFAQNNEIEWREDSSNSELKYIRNKIRHEVIPKLEEINPTILQNFKKTTVFLKQNQQLVYDRITNVSKSILVEKTIGNNQVIEINIPKLLDLSNPKAYVYQILKQYGFTEWDDVYRLLFAQTGKQIFSKTHRLLKNRDFLILTENILDRKGVQEYFFDKNITKTQIPVKLSFDKVAEVTSQEKNTIFVDNDLVKYPFCIRKWQEGDFFYPKGMQGRKKLSKFFKDEKFSQIEKENVWLLCSADSRIIWVIGKRQDERFAISKNSKEVLKITIHS